MRRMGWRKKGVRKVLEKHFMQLSGSEGRKTFSHS
jgi:hypothetical protein